MRRKEVLFLCMVLLLVSSILPLHNSYAASWYNSNWLYRQKITILPTLADADLTNFPYLVKITDGANPLFASAQADHDDILFTKSDGVTKLDHEIEYYESASGSEELDAWVRVEAISSTLNTEIYMYYGNSSASNQENKTGTWDGDFVMVQHLNETSGTHFDSTLNNNVGTPMNGVTQGTPGKIDGADSFDMVDDRIDIPDSTSLQVVGMTLEAWVYIPDSLPASGFHGILNHGSSSNTNWYCLALDATNQQFHYRWSIGAVRRTNFSTTISANNWYHVVGVLNASTSTAYTYLNGSLDTTVTGASLPSPSASTLYIGRGLSTELFKGFIDEVRISKKARDPEWITASYQNHNSPDTYQALSLEEQVHNIAGTVFEDANFSGTASDYDGGTTDLALQNVDVELYDSNNVYIDSTTTDANGNFSFSGLLDNTYKVRVRSATIADADTPPKGGLNATVPVTWPYPLPEMTWGNGAALYGGQSATMDDTTTGDNAGPGDTYVSVTVSGADVSGVNLGFAHNLIVNTGDDSNANNALSKQGSLRQFIKNANAIGTAGSTTANSSQFRIPIALLDVNGVAPIAPVAALPTISDTTGGTIIDGTTQTSNIGDTNASGPEIEIDGSGAGTVDGFIMTSADNEIRGMVINGFAAAGTAGIRLSSAAATNNTIAGNYIGTNFDGTSATPNRYGVYLLSSANANTIGGSVAADRNIISGNAWYGVFIINAGSDANIIKGNYIGTNKDGTAAVANANGVYLQSGPQNTIIGGTTAADRNVISGNTQNGIYLFGANTNLNQIQGNYIGTDCNGTGAVPNNWGVYIQLGPQSNTIGGTAGGAGNTIAYNTMDGIYLIGSGSTGNQLSSNAIFENGGLGIDLDPDGVTANDTGDSDTGPNNLQNFPVLTLASTLGGMTTVEVTLNSAAGTTFRIEFFSSPAEDPSGYGEGQTYLGSTNITTDGSGDQTFTFPTSVPLGQVITATATDPNNNTSEFSKAETVIEGNDIAIDCTFSDWTDVDGTEFVIDDEGGQDDWWSPSKYDITRFGVASNLSDTFYLLFGFDDINPQRCTAAVLIDTDLDNNINYAVTVTLETVNTTVELFTCDNSIPYGCGNQTLSKTYTTSDYCRGTGTGPWNTDTFVEVQFPYSDLPLFTGGSSILTSLITYNKIDLNKPKDSIYADYYDRTLYDTDTGEGETIDNAGTPTIAGTIFTDEGTTSVGIGKTVGLLDNGSLADTDTTDDDGYYFMVVPAFTADNLLAYIDGDLTYKGTTVTVFDGTLLSDLDIYAGHVITRHDNGGALSTVNMASAKGGATDSDILYSVSGGTDLTVTGSGTELYVPTGYSFAPGGNVTTPNMENLGTFTGGTGAIDINGTLTLGGGSFSSTSGTMNVAGDFTHAGGTFSHNSGTVSLDGTGQTISGSTTFNTLSKTVAATDTLTFTAGSTQTIAGTVTLTGADGNRLNLRSSSDGTRWNFTVPASATKDISYVDVKDSDASGSDATQKPISPATSVDSGNCIDWFSTLPDIVLLKSVQTFSDPYNSETNPKAIPGAVMLYTVSATNQGVGATDADTVFLTDPIPVNTALFVGDINGAGSGPVLFTDGTPPNDSGLNYTFTSLDSLTDDVAFSNDDGATYTYVPVPDGNGFDTNVTHMRITPKGTFKAASGGDVPTFDVKFKVQVE